MLHLPTFDMGWLTENRAGCRNGGSWHSQCDDRYVSQRRHDGSLVRVLPEYELEPLKAFAVFPSGPRPSAKILALVTHLIARR